MRVEISPIAEISDFARVILPKSFVFAKFRRAFASKRLFGACTCA